jgi:hypothetical protein
MPGPLCVAGVIEGATAWKAYVAHGLPRALGAYVHLSCVSVYQQFASCHMDLRDLSVAVHAVHAC